MLFIKLAEIGQLSHHFPQMKHGSKFTQTQQYLVIWSALVNQMNKGHSTLYKRYVSGVEMISFSSKAHDIYHRDPHYMSTYGYMYE